LRHLEARVLHYNGSDPLYFTQKSLELLAEFSFGQFEPLAEIAGRMAQEARAAGDFDRARSHFAVQARLLKSAKLLEGAEGARVAMAECWADEARSREQAGASIAATRKAMTGLSLEDAFLTFATLIPLIDPVNLREEAIEYIRDHPLQSLHDAHMFDAAGRKVGTRSPSMPNCA
jgi:hypothetical protein